MGNSAKGHILKACSRASFTLKRGLLGPQENCDRSPSAGNKLGVWHQQTWTKISSLVFVSHALGNVFHFSVPQFT